MNFNFYINGENNQDNTDIENILKDIETHLEDWNNFYNLYQMFAPPPTDNTKQIKAWFKELQQSFLKLIKKYNETIHHFADIQEIQETDVQEIMKDTISNLNEKKKSIKKKDINDDVNMMYG